MLQHELGFLRGIPSRAFRELRVDSILLQAGTKKNRDLQVKNLKITWQDLGFRSDEVVCRAETVDKDCRSLLDFTPPLPTSCGEQPELVPWWRDLSEEQAHEAVMKAEGLNVCGVAGTGKSTWVSKIISELKARGERVEIIARCHVSSKALGGQTADKFILSKLGSFRQG